MNKSINNERILNESDNELLLEHTDDYNDNRFERNKQKRPKNLTANSEMKSIIFSIFSILTYYCFSILLTFYNRHLFVKFKFPLSITLAHLVFKFFAAAFLRIMYNICNKESKRRITLDWNTYWRKIIPAGAASATDIGFSNWSLKYITITLYTMSKSTAILFIFMFSILFKLEKWQRSIILVVLSISFGLFFFTYTSTQFHLFGFILVMIASFSTGLRWTLSQLVCQKHELGLANPIDMIFHIQPAMIACLLPLALFIEGKSLFSSDHSIFHYESLYHLGTNVFLVLIGASLAFVLEASEYLVVTYTSSLTLSISGIFKEVCVVILAVEINHNKLNSLNIIGLVFILVGIITHVILKARHQADILIKGDDSSDQMNLNHRKLSFDREDTEDETHRESKI